MQRSSRGSLHEPVHLTPRSSSLTDIPFLCTSLTTFFFMFGTFLPFDFIPSQAEYESMSPYLAGYLLSILNAVKYAVTLVFTVILFLILITCPHRSERMLIRIASSVVSSPTTQVTNSAVLISWWLSPPPPPSSYLPSGFPPAVTFPPYSSLHSTASHLGLLCHWSPRLLPRSPISARLACGLVSIT
jgi:hypothetical protein